MKTVTLTFSFKNIAYITSWMLFGILIGFYTGYKKGTVDSQSASVDSSMMARTTPDPFANNGAAEIDKNRVGATSSAAHEMRSKMELKITKDKLESLKRMKASIAKAMAANKGAPGGAGATDSSSSIDEQIKKEEEKLRSLESK